MGYPMMSYKVLLKIQKITILEVLFEWSKSIPIHHSDGSFFPDQGPPPTFVVFPCPRPRGNLHGCGWAFVGRLVEGVEVSTWTDIYIYIILYIYYIYIFRIMIEFMIVPGFIFVGLIIVGFRS